MNVGQDKSSSVGVTVNDTLCSDIDINDGTSVGEGDDSSLITQAGVDNGGVDVVDGSTNDTANNSGTLVGENVGADVGDDESNGGKLE